MKNQQRGFALIIILLLALVVIGGVVYVYISKSESGVSSIAELQASTTSKSSEASSTSDESLNGQPMQASSSPMIPWKTYTNAQYGFSIQYPSDMNVETEGNLVQRGTRYTSIVIFTSKETDSAETEVASNASRAFYIKIYNASVDGSVLGTDEISGNGSGSTACFNGDFKINTTVGVGHYPAREMNFTDPSVSCDPIYFFSLDHGGFIYNIIPVTNGNTNYAFFNGKTETAKLLPEFSSILATFKFLK